MARWQVGVLIVIFVTAPASPAFALKFGDSFKSYPALKIGEWGLGAGTESSVLQRVLLALFIQVLPCHPSMSRPWRKGEEMEFGYRPRLHAGQGQGTHKESLKKIFLQFFMTSKFSFNRNEVFLFNKNKKG